MLCATGVQEPYFSKYWLKVIVSGFVNEKDAASSAHSLPS